MSRKIILARALQAKTQETEKPSVVIEQPRTELRNVTPLDATVNKENNQSEQLLPPPAKRRRLMKPVPPVNVPVQEADLSTRRRARIKSAKTENGRKKSIESKSYRCETCNQAFTVQSKFAELLKIYKGKVIPFAAVSLKCPTCNAAFRTGGNLPARS